LNASRSGIQSLKLVVIGNPWPGIAVGTTPSGLTTPAWSPGFGPTGPESPTRPLPGIGVTPAGRFLQPTVPLASTNPIAAKPNKAESLILFVSENLFCPTGLRVAPRNSTDILDLFRGHVKQRQDPLASLPSGKNHRAGVGRPRRIFTGYQYLYAAFTTAI